MPIKTEKNYAYFPPRQKNNQDQQTLMPITIDLDLKFPPNYWILPSLVVTMLVYSEVGLVPFLIFFTIKINDIQINLMEFQNIF